MFKIISNIQINKINIIKLINILFIFILIKLKLFNKNNFTLNRNHHLYNFKIIMCLFSIYFRLTLNNLSFWLLPLKRY